MSSSLTITELYSFLTRSVYDMRDNLRKIGSDLSIWAGQPHVILERLVKALQNNGDRVHGVWMGREPHTEEIGTEVKIKKALSSSQVSVRTFDHRTLIHHKDLPFPLAELPDVYTQFRKRVEAPDMYRAPAPAPKQLKPFADIASEVKNEAGVYKVGGEENEVLEQLLKPLQDEPNPVAAPKDDVNAAQTSAFPYRGGETEALQRLDHYFSGGARSAAAMYKETRNGMLGADYSTKVSLTGF
jgi:deoxyribodipyrimidine photo-lyase